MPGKGHGKVIVGFVKAPNERIAARQRLSEEVRRRLDYIHIEKINKSIIRVHQIPLNGGER